MVWLTNETRLDLFPAMTIVRDAHYYKTTTRHEQDLNLYRGWVQA